MAFKDTRLPFFERPDLSPFLVHLTKANNSFTAYQNLINILKSREIWGSDKGKGFIKGPNSATCFMDIPLSSLKYVLNKSNTDPKFPRYEPYGIIFSKTYAYEQGARPVLYLSNCELKEMGIPDDHLWRVVRLEGVEEDSIGWIHEREWRAQNNFPIPKNPFAVLVKDANSAVRLNSYIKRCSDEIKCLPQSIIPLTILCQGLPYMKEKGK